MSIAEWFLLVWALSATFLAVFHNHRFKRARHASYMAHAMLVGLMRGEAQMRKFEGGAVFTLNNEEVDSEIRIETR